MTRFQYISSNIDRVKNEVRMGLMPTSVLNHYAIYSRYDYYRKLGNPVSVSVLFTGESCRVTERCVFNVIKTMEAEV